MTQDGQGVPSKTIGNKVMQQVQGDTSSMPDSVNNSYVGSINQMNTQYMHLLNSIPPTQPN